MNREIEFFITEDQPIVRQWEEEKRESGAVVVGSTGEMLERFFGMTQLHESVNCRLSGAWLDECIQKSVRALLSLKRNPDNFKQPVVSGLEVDLRTCFSYADFHEGSSIDARRKLLESLIGIHLLDPRLTILPAPEDSPALAGFRNIVRR